jgi:HlyD family secretion protein
VGLAILLRRKQNCVMKRNWKKIGLIAGIVLLLVGVVGFTVIRSQKDVLAVQTGSVVREDLTSMVSASGEIKPKTYVNVGANAFGKIVKLHVREGDHVKRGQILAQLENVQSAADVAAQRASLQVARTDAEAAQAAHRTAVADLNRAKADAQQKKLDWERAENLYKSALISKAEYDARQAAFEAADAGLAQAQARLAQAKAQQESAGQQINQVQATLTRASDQLTKTIYVAPFDGTITNLPVREGETVVMGIQNSPGSTLMTIADLSVITAEVKVDETDIVHIRNGQPAEVTIDALPKQVFKGTVTEIGNNAMIRSTGLATTQTTSGSQEAKDFKVVVTLQDPPPNLRPGLSTTAKVTTATKSNVLAIPIQALTLRKPSELEPKDKKKNKDSVQAAAPDRPRKNEDKELQGVFVVGPDNRAQFREVQTGITGTTEIEVLSGLEENQRIVTGSYKVLRSLRNGARVKEEKTEVKKDEATS